MNGKGHNSLQVKEYSLGNKAESTCFYLIDLHGGLHMCGCVYCGASALCANICVCMCGELVM